MTIANLPLRQEAAGRSASQAILFWFLGPYNVRGLVCFHLFSLQPGLRFFYLSIMIGGWIASPIACLVITVVMLVIQYFLDRSVSGYLRR